MIFFLFTRHLNKVKYIYSKYHKLKSQNLLYRDKTLCILGSIVRRVVTWGLAGIFVLLNLFPHKSYERETLDKRKYPFLQCNKGKILGQVCHSIGREGCIRRPSITKSSRLMRKNALFLQKIYCQIIIYSFYVHE